MTKMLPRPSLTFTLPSICDGTKLDCRLYHPESLTIAPGVPQWGRDVAIVAHPYAPFGGCADDSVVDVIAGTLLGLGFMVATFNFRGASPSGGRTSWTSKPERGDYMSVVGFMAYYVQYLDIFRGDVTPTMLMAGFSYGALVTARLPPLESILARFDCPVVHSPAAEIRLRAQVLAEQQIKLLATPMSPRKSLGMRVGGCDGTRESGVDGRRSHSYDREDRIRKGVKDILARTKLVRKRHRFKSHGKDEQREHVVEHMDVVKGMVTFHSSYLVVSPPVGFVTTLATMSFWNPLGAVSRLFSKDMATAAEDDEAERRKEAADREFAVNPSLVIYGDQDGLIMRKRMREWVAKLQHLDKSCFRDIEVAGAGHFWGEEGVGYELRDAVEAFGAEVLRRHG